MSKGFGYSMGQLGFIAAAVALLRLAFYFLTSEHDVDERKPMKNKNLNQIKNTIVKQLTDLYGFCGVADSDNVAMLNSGAGAEDFQITIKDQSAIDAARAAIEKEIPKAS